MINPARGFWPMFGPLGPTAGPGSPGNGPGSKDSAACTKNQPRRPILSSIRGHFVFLGPTGKREKDNLEAPQGLPSFGWEPHASSGARLEGSWGPSLAGESPKIHENKKTYLSTLSAFQYMSKSGHTWVFNTWSSGRPEIDSTYLQPLRNVKFTFCSA